MSEEWKQWEGRTIDGKFLLQSFSGASEHSAVFLAQGADAQNAAIKLIPADAVEAEGQLRRWKAARDLSHPNLIRVFDAGSCQVEGTQLLYVVEEYAEENLAQILPERALTTEETRGMLPPVLRALQFVHDQGFVHGHIQPSNILAIGEQVKLSSDALSAPGETSGGAGTTNAYDPPEAGVFSTTGDVWQLGMTLIEVLTRRLPVWDRARPIAPEVPAGVPEPFREIAAHCLQVDAAKRWTVAEIAAHLEPGGSKAARPVAVPAHTEKAVAAAEIVGQRKASAKWPYLVGLAAAVAVGFLFLARPKPAGPPGEYQFPQTQQSPASESAKSALTSTTAEPKPSPAAVEEAKAGDEKASQNTDAGSTDHQSGIVRRVMPQVSPSARRTIQGKVRVRVKVEVDTAGNVAKAEFASAGPSKYFSRLALEAARGWRFSPAPAGESGERQWKLQFVFSRARTEVSAVRAKG
jgi:TonB family protein